MFHVVVTNVSKRHAVKCAIRYAVACRDSAFTAWDCARATCYPHSEMATILDLLLKAKLVNRVYTAGESVCAPHVYVCKRSVVLRADGSGGAPVDVPSASSLLDWLQSSRGVRPV